MGTWRMAIFASDFKREEEGKLLRIPPLKMPSFSKQLESDLRGNLPHDAYVARDLFHLWMRG